MHITNTKRSGIARTIIFKSSRKFKAVCLDFDIIEEASTREAAEIQIKEAIIGYIKNVCKNKLDDKLLNRHAEKKYWDRYFKYLRLIEKPQRIVNNIESISMFTMPINAKMLCSV
ncbi:hypothetical protein HY932_02360 [Candidatus Falkowbacteria bacterium]|nr:hypothetical protein [Candidatus Falkowbacteria bacterium]